MRFSEYDNVTVADGYAARERLIARARTSYRFLIKLRYLRGGRVAHRADAAGLPLCGVRIVGEQWTLAPSPRGQRVCGRCARKASGP